MWLKLLVEILLRDRLLIDRGILSGLLFSECLISFDYSPPFCAELNAVRFLPLLPNTSLWSGA
jgi:hypothetical protein